MYRSLWINGTDQLQSATLVLADLMLMVSGHNQARNETR